MSKSQDVRDFCPVPLEQRPLTEYERLKERPGFAWTTQSQSRYLKVLGILTSLFLGLCLLLGTASTQPTKEANSLTLLAYSISGTITLLTLVYVRVYLGWQYVYNRLMKSTVPYEESGWYDGQTWVKSPEALVKDRLTGTYQLRPILTRLKSAMAILLGLQLVVVVWIAS
nr:photosystem I assembly protein Ycf36 [Proteomonas sp. NEIS-1375]